MLIVCIFRTDVHLTQGLSVTEEWACLRDKIERNTDCKVMKDGKLLSLDLKKIAAIEEASGVCCTK